ncbi:hypothetical protein M5K25_012284 [Dendrobium thyrsiflorum]|uniref:Uncharacterized protein n=1 Tax=Dendrobium thyrsiflorum TaxID=117978 RepID=A0ABD0UX18_DENTH
MASTRRGLRLVPLVLSFAWLLMGSNIFRAPPMAEATRVLKDVRYIITTRAGLVFESKPKGSGPGSEHSCYHHGPDGGSGICPPL